MAKYDKFFKLAKEAGLTDVELSIFESRSLDIEIFHSNIESYSDNNGFTIVARGIYKNGKACSASCDTWNAEKAAFLVKSMVENAKVIENDDPVFIFKGSEKYHKVSTYNKDLDNVSVDFFIKKAMELEKEIKAVDSRVNEVTFVGFSLANEKSTLINTNGLKLSQKSNYFVYSAQATAKQGEQTKSGYDFFIDNNVENLNIKDLANKVANNALDLLGGEPCASKKYKAVLDRDVVKSLLRAYISHADAEEVQKNSSLFKGKLNAKIASKKLTIEDKPLQKTLFAKWFDDEGVATYNKAIIKNGVLQTYLYNLTTAAKDGVQTTANAVGAGAKKGAAPTLLVVKPGRKTKEQLFEKVFNGVYITDITGLHAGLNHQSGDFSLQANGFMIENGKKTKPLDLITVSGNLMEIFEDVVDLANDVSLSPSGTYTPSMMIKKIGVSGK